VGVFRAEYTERKPEIAKSTSKVDGFMILRTPYIHFEASLKEIKLFGMLNYVDVINAAMIKTLKGGDGSVANFIAGCLTKTETLLSTLEQKQSSLFIAPWGKSIAPGAFVRLFTIDKTKAIDDSMLDEKVLRSEPGVISVRTDNRFSPFPRGLYWYSVIIGQGKKVGKGTLNLVDGQAENISCGVAVDIASCQND